MIRFYDLGTQKDLSVIELYTRSYVNETIYPPDLIKRFKNYIIIT